MGRLDAFYNSLFAEEQRFCPRCHEAFYPGECDIVATFPPHTRGEVLYASKKGAWARKNPKSIAGEYMKRLATRMCPNPQCGYYLPRNIDTTPVLNIAVVGDYQAGKSHYIASLIKQLQEKRVVPDDQYFRLVGMTPLVEARYNHEYLSKLFGAHEPLQRTRPLTPGDMIDPLIYELTFRRSQDHWPKTVNLAIHDASGEDYSTPEKIVEFTQHVINANGLIYLADPMALPDIKKGLPSSLHLSPDTISPTATFNMIIKLIEEFRGLPAGAKLMDFPIAVTLSKSDLLKKKRPPGNPFTFSTNPLYQGGADLLDLAKVEQEVLEVLNNYAGDRSLIPATQTIEKKHFLAISATGMSPDASGSYPNVEPCRCLDPFLWILYQLELIPAVGQP
ncbi:MAG TPA: hypothetical protein VN729_02790 [Ktedonobacteraceae bacterium]|nr:hypothetical protein [Ktedonobacteraceae bacterium]